MTAGTGLAESDLGDFARVRRTGRISELVLAVADIERIEIFYKDSLGFQSVTHLDDHADFPLALGHGSESIRMA